jgi:CheY-like chemotaxis protein
LYAQYQYDTQLLSSLLEKSYYHDAPLPLGASRISPEKDKVLFVTENLSDQHLIQIALRELKMEMEPVFIQNELEFTEFLKQLADCKEKSPRAVFIDYYLSFAKGMELLGHIRQQFCPQELPVILMLPLLFPQLINASFEAGANTCILMPVDFFELEKVLAGAIKWAVGRA